jgi:hypothetical protein
LAAAALAVLLLILIAIGEARSRRIGALVEERCQRQPAIDLRVSVNPAGYGKA